MLRQLPPPVNPVGLILQAPTELVCNGLFRGMGIFGPVGLLRTGHSLVLTLATHHRLLPPADPGQLVLAFAKPQT